eukprot:TRINITY_DN1482_c0_g1_i2.p1 TRINITY_DN1482_c0_g1~~TRINITY_DN1482_c0_g1_i2.p1  ORF type:complete len:113 (-),score=26.86 TRINITY_DN1482_c0_g1_i2:128-466(-)
MCIRDRVSTQSTWGRMERESDLLCDGAPMKRVFLEDGSVIVGPLSTSSGHRDWRKVTKGKRIAAATVREHRRKQLEQRKWVETHQSYHPGEAPEGELGLTPTMEEEVSPSEK